MSTEPSLGFDPYRVWLNIQEPQRPLNPYQLLGLRALETEQARIRSAITRTRGILEAKRAEGPAVAWEKVNQEVEDAIGKLQDPDQKMLVDATIKRQSNRGGPKPSSGGGGGNPNAPSAAKAGATEVVCRDCETANPPNRRFCLNCGSPLFDSCPVCNVEVTAAEKFCGSCGTNLVETLRKQEAEFEEKIKQARQYQHDHQFEKAAGILRNIAVTEDARFERFARKAMQLLERFASERKQYEERAAGKIDKARKYMERYSYEKAMAALLEISETLRTPEVVAMLEEARAKRNELLQLGGEIREAMQQNRKHDLLPKIERMLGLKPDHTQARELAVSLRDNICASAKKKLQTHSYDEARIMLETIPTFVRNDEVEKLFDKAIELDGLAVDIRLSPVIDETLPALTDRLAKLSPQDEVLAKQAADLRKKAQAKPNDPWGLYAPWGTPPRRTLLGMQVEALGPLVKCDFDSPALEETARKNPAAFHTVLGLALQAVQQAQVNVDLLPAEKGNLLTNLTSMLRRATPTGWGIDLSPAGVKVMRLGTDPKEKKVKVLALDFIPHAKPLPQVEEEIERTEILQETLKAAKAKHAIPSEKEKGKERVVGAISSRWTFARFFDLPPVANSKIPDAITFEAKHQIPIPLNELNWGYHTIREGDGKDPKQPIHVVLLAVKDFHMKERLQLFKNADIGITNVTADPVALHNALVYEFLSDDTVPETDYFGFMDLGTEGSSFVISSKKTFWFRTTGISGNDLTNTLVKKFQLTHAQAEDLKRNPHKARRYHLFWEALQPLFVQISSEVERSVGSYAKLFPNRSMKRLYLTGGVAQTHGLLRYMIHGR